MKMDDSRNDDHFQILRILFLKNTSIIMLFYNITMIFNFEK